MPSFLFIDLYIFYFLFEVYVPLFELKVFGAD